MTIIEIDAQPLLSILNKIHEQLLMQTKELMEINENLRLKAQIEKEKK